LSELQVFQKQQMTNEVAGADPGGLKVFDHPDLSPLAVDHRINGSPEYAGPQNALPAAGAFWGARYVP
jgi:hypothetical protein